MKRQYICDFCGSFWIGNKKICALCGAGSKIVMNSKDDCRQNKRKDKQ